jgi:hypothetical protein
MLHKEFWGLTFLAFVVWIFMSSNPSIRIERTCKPLAWTGNIITSLTALAVPSQQQRVQKWSRKLDYGCQYTLWRLFYQDRYNQYLQELQKKNAVAPGALPGESDNTETPPEDGAPNNNDTPPEESSSKEPDPTKANPAVIRDEALYQP